MEQAAAKAGVSKFTLSAVVNGRITGNVELWVGMASALEVSIGWLLNGEGEPWAETTKTAEASSPPPHQSHLSISEPTRRAPPLPHTRATGKPTISRSPATRRTRKRKP